jgi:hypothetical protein
MLCDAFDEEIDDRVRGALGPGLRAVLPPRLIAMASARTVRAG